MTDEKRIEIFIKLIEHEGRDGLSGGVAERILESIEYHPLYAISGDTECEHGLLVCDELNLFSSKKRFEDCKVETIKEFNMMRNPSNLTWNHETSHPLGCFVIDEFKIEEQMDFIDFYVTAEMEGFDEIVKKLKTIAEIALL